MKSKTKKILIILGIILLIIAVAIVLYISIYSSVIAFDNGVTVNTETLANTTFIEPTSKDMLLFGNKNILISENDPDLTYIVVAPKIMESIIKYEIKIDDKIKTYYIKFITEDKIYSSQLNAYLYKW